MLRGSLGVDEVSSDACIFTCTGFEGIYGGSSFRPFELSDMPTPNDEDYVDRLLDINKPMPKRRWTEEGIQKWREFQTRANEEMDGILASSKYRWHRNSDMMDIPREQRQRWMGLADRLGVWSGDMPNTDMGIGRARQLYTRWGMDIRDQDQREINMAAGRFLNEREVAENARLATEGTPNPYPHLTSRGVKQVLYMLERYGGVKHMDPSEIKSQLQDARYGRIRARAIEEAAAWQPGQSPAPILKVLKLFDMSRHLPRKRTG